MEIFYQSPLNTNGGVDKKIPLSFVFFGLIVSFFQSC